MARGCFIRLITYEAEIIELDLFFLICENPSYQRYSCAIECQIQDEISYFICILHDILKLHLRLS